VFCEESYNTFSTLLSFITKLNSNQLNIKKIKLTKIILGKNITKKKTQKKPEKNHVEKNTMSIHRNLRGKLQCFSHIL
jgi:hypothetical protein